MLLVAFGIVRVLVGGALVPQPMHVTLWCGLQDGVMLHRVLPWLWRLADEEVRPYAPTRSQQQQLLEALECCPAAEDLQVRWLV